MTDKLLALEFNFDSLVGPTHNYAGLSFGNIASKSNAGTISNPKQAAKQGLQKMRTLMQLGIPQAVLPPQQRPNFALLRSLGFNGNEAQILEKTYKYQPKLLAACHSAASMWAANMATVSPSCNTNDSKLHLTPANLTHNLHRAQEAEFSYKLLSKIFANSNFFKVHKPLAAYTDLGDEGAANHNILCTDYGQPGLEIFVYGKLGLEDASKKPAHFPSRQSRLASSTIIRQHGLRAEQTLLVQQNPLAIDAGIFHNDVICVMNKNVIFYHEKAFLDSNQVIQQIKQKFTSACYFIEVSDNQLSLATAVETYIFNSQLVSLANGDMALIVPMECKHSKQASDLLDSIVSANNPINKIQHVECRESMRNGGGPACLRLRVVLTPEQQQACHQGIFLDDNLYTKLDAWIDRHYRDHLAAEDLLDPLLSQEVLEALAELTDILKLGSIYPFQQN
jgi:succinylarginine dihydrolase